MAPACQNSPSNDGVPGGSQSGLRTNCGVVFDTQLLNPINDGAGQEVLGLTPIEPYIYQVTLANSEELVVLHGIEGVKPESVADARSAIINLSRQRLYLFRPRKAPNCLRSTAYGDATVVNIVNRAGVSFAEELSRRRFATTSPPSYNACFEQLVQPCYAALFEQGR